MASAFAGAVNVASTLNRPAGSVSSQSVSVSSFLGRSLRKVSSEFLISSRPASGGFKVGASTEDESKQTSKDRWGGLATDISHGQEDMTRAKGMVDNTKLVDTFNGQSIAFIPRRALLVGVGLLSSATMSRNSAFAQDVPENYTAFVDFSDGYSYYYPSEWRDFDFLAHDSAFKDRTLPLQNVRVSFKPTEKSDVRDLGSMEEVITNLVTNVYSAPSQRTQIFNMQERSVDGKNYWTFEYEIASPGFSRAAFATIAVGNGKYYTLIVGANERRWKKLRDKLKVVAVSFKIFDA